MILPWPLAVHEELPKLSDPLRNLEIISRPALEGIERFGNSEMLLSLDLPYPGHPPATWPPRPRRYKMTDDGRRPLAERSPPD